MALRKKDIKEVEKAVALIEEARAIVERALQGAQDAVEGRTEKWLESEKGEEAQANLEVLERVFESLENAESDLNGMTGET